MAEITTEAIEPAVAPVALMVAREVAIAENATEAMVEVVVKVVLMGAKEVAMAEAMVEKKVINRDPITLVYQIEVQAHLLILNRNSHLQGLILVCTFIHLEEIFLLHIYDLENNFNIFWHQLIYELF